MKKLRVFCLAFLISIVVGSGLMASMEIKKACDESAPCTKCHSGIPKKGDADKKLNDFGKKLLECNPQKDVNMWKPCYNK